MKLKQTVTSQNETQDVQRPVAETIVNVATPSPTEPVKKKSKLEQRLQEVDIQVAPLQQQFETKLKNLCYRTRLSMESNVLDYWQNKKTDSDIYSVSQIVLATPATQVSVERAFSALAQILGPLRTNLSIENLNNILLIKLNEFLFDEIDLKIYK